MPKKRTLNQKDNKIHYYLNRTNNHYSCEAEMDLGTKSTENHNQITCLQCLIKNKD